jgi:peptide/nickel transport system substrate-binding protein
MQRRAQKSPPGLGGWQMYHANLTGVECIDGTNKWVRANGEKASFGWPDNPQVEAEVGAWFDATSLAEEEAVARRLNKAALDHVVHAPIGCYLRQHASRKNITGIARGPLPFFWEVGKAV